MNTIQILRKTWESMTLVSEPTKTRGSVRKDAMGHHYELMTGPACTVRPMSAAEVLGSLGGSKKTPAQAAARRKNGEKGGRPKGSGKGAK